MLRLEGVQAGYDGSTVLQDMEFEIAQGQALALLGRNGMGKTTTIRAIFGLIRPSQGRIWIKGRDMTGAQPFAVARAGLGLVPEGRQIFPNLSVAENLRATARSGPWNLAAIYDLFPRLAERQGHGGNQLSGGEQQMLAIGRALMTNPDLLVLDEATEGLAPLIRAEIWACLARLRAEGLAILVIDKDIPALTSLVDGLAVVEKGRIVWRAVSGTADATPEALAPFLHV